MIISKEYMAIGLFRNITMYAAILFRVNFGLLQNTFLQQPTYTDLWTTPQKVCQRKLWRKNFVWCNYKNISCSYLLV